MKPLRASDKHRHGDVPLGVAAGLVATLVALFLPMASVGPAYPTSLPALSHDPEATLAAHRADLALPRPAATPIVLEAWRALSAAQARRDATAMSVYQPRFAHHLFEATGHNPAADRAVRAAARERFLREVNDARAPLTQVAARHRLAGPDAAPTVDDAQRVARFDLRWERLALPVRDDGTELEPITTTLLRVPPPSQRAFVAWGVSASCMELLGAVERRPTLTDPRRCATFRRDLVTLASAMDRSYPRDEARAAVEVMLATGLLRVTDASRTDRDVPVEADATGTARDDAHAAFARARDLYAGLLRRDRERRVERYYRATVAELGGE